jgi:hypothetical protein
MQFIRLKDTAQLVAAGLPWDTYGKAHWAFRNRERLGLKDAFRKHGRGVLVIPERAKELLDQQGPA